MRCRLQLLKRLGCFALAGAALVPAEARTWTDQAGAQIEAEILEKADSTVTIRRADGRVFTLPIARLSDADQLFVAGWVPISFPIPPIEEALVLIETSNGSGSGFLAQMGGHVFVLTNQHVIAGVDAKEIVVQTQKSERVTFGRLEVSATLDLARLWVEPRPALVLAHAVSLESVVAAYGNSQGAGVATLGRGRVLGVAADRIEIDAEIVPGNSGGPLIDSAGHVVGVASYLRRPARAEDWTTAGTRYAQARRFAFRPLAVDDWTPVEWGVYRVQMQRVEAARNLVEQAWNLAAEMVRNPAEAVVLDPALPGGLRNIAQRQNDHVKRIQGRIGERIGTQTELNRANESFNAIYRDNLDALASLIDSETKGLELRTPRLSMPYQLEQAREIREDAMFLIERIEAAKHTQHSFLRASYLGL